MNFISQKLELYIPQNKLFNIFLSVWARKTSDIRFRGVSLFLC